MTLDKTIETLQSIKKELGGDTELRIALHCNGNADYVDIKEINNSKIFGLRFEVSPPWWVYQ